MSDFVLDASMALAWVLDHPIAPYALEIRSALARGKRGLVPALWHLEIANALATAERRRDLVGADLDDALTTIQMTATAALDTDMNLITIREILANARSFQLTAYDAAYLELARRETLPLATLDKSLQVAAKKAGVRTMA